MFIPPNRLKDKFEQTEQVHSAVRLKSSHLLVDRKIVAAIFGADQNVNMVYYPDRHALMIAPKSDDLFKQLHKTKQHLLKDRNTLGDKTISLRELLIDNELDPTDRDLEYEYQAALKVLTVKL